MLNGWRLGGHWLSLAGLHDGGMRDGLLTVPAFRGLASPSGISGVMRTHLTSGRPGISIRWSFRGGVIPVCLDGVRSGGRFTSRPLTRILAITIGSGMPMSLRDRMGARLGLSG